MNRKTQLCLNFVCQIVSLFVSLHPVTLGFGSNWSSEMLDFEEGEKPGNPEINPRSKDESNIKLSLMTLSP